MYGCTINKCEHGIGGACISTERTVHDDLHVQCACFVTAMSCRFAVC